MIATVTSQTTSLVSSYSTTANQASAPLPGIPRRSSSTLLSPATPVPIRVTVQAPSPPHMTAQCSSSSSSTLVSDSATASDDWVPLTAVVSRGFVLGPEHSTPIPAVHRARATATFPIIGSVAISADLDSAEDDTPRASPRPTRSASTSAIHTQQQPALASSHTRSKTMSVSSQVFKKSGQPLKSSLKSPKSTQRPGLSVLTFSGSSLAKSEPTTPTHVKNVHFDAKLEHVKLFLAEQKPLAVSRDGSPTDDTSGTDSDFPSFIYGSTRDKKPIVALTLRNMPSIIKHEADVVLNHVNMSSDSESILGRVTVRNLAFEKWVAVRFTFDEWQTTSEVTGRYEESLMGGTFDRFGFTIRLNGLLSRIEGREMWFAVRYNVNGKEFWDNNDGKNYHAVFSLATSSSAAAPAPVPAGRQGSTGSGSDVGEDLKTKLQEVVIQRWDSKVRAEQGPSFRSTSSLAPRYDFAASLKNSNWRTDKANNSIPWPSDGRSSPITPPRRVGKQRTPLGSPRDLDGETTYRPTFLKSAPEPASSSVTLRARNHHRGGGTGYFDSSFSPSEPIYGVGFRNSPTHTPRIRSMDDMSPLSSPRPCSSEDKHNLTPKPSLTRLVLPQLTIPDDTSADSTPSIASPTSTSSSSRSSSPSPVDEIASNPLIAGASDNNQDYRQFVNRYCFYTGNARVGLDLAPQITRAHSDSSVEEYLMKMSPSSSTDTLRCITPTPS